MVNRTNCGPVDAGFLMQLPDGSMIIAFIVGDSLNRNIRKYTAESAGSK